MENGPFIDDKNDDLPIKNGDFILYLLNLVCSLTDHHKLVG